MKTISMQQQLELKKKISFNFENHASSLIVTVDSGRVIFRRKIDTVIGVNHPGIILGEDIWGNIWVVHNHYEHGAAVVETLNNFCKGQPWWFDARPEKNDRYEILNTALEHWKLKKPYHWLTNNCEHFVNRVIRDEHKSDTVDKVSNSALWFGSLLALIGLIIGKKDLTKAGLSIAGTGLLGKAISRV